MTTIETVLYYLIVYSEAILFAIGALIGLAFIPLLAKTVGNLLPDFIGEALANRVWKVALVGLGNAVIWQEDSDEYTIQGVRRDDYQPPNAWSRLMGNPIAVSYTRTKEAFGDCVEQLDPRALVTDGSGGPPGDRAVKDSVERGGSKTFVEAEDDSDAGLYVRVGEYASRLKDADGLDVISKAKDQTIKTEGGKGGLSTMAKAIYWSTMAIVGTFLGIFMFFL